MHIKRPDMLLHRRYPTFQKTLRKSVSKQPAFHINSLHSSPQRRSVSRYTSPLHQTLQWHPATPRTTPSPTHSPILASPALASPSARCRSSRPTRPPTPSPPAYSPLNASASASPTKSVPSLPAATSPGPPTSRPYSRAQRTSPSSPSTRRSRPRPTTGSSRVAPALISRAASSVGGCSTLAAERSCARAPTPPVGPPTSSASKEHAEAEAARVRSFAPPLLPPHHGRPRGLRVFCSRSCTPITPTAPTHLARRHASGRHNIHRKQETITMTMTTRPRSTSALLATYQNRISPSAPPGPRATECRLRLHLQPLHPPRRGHAGPRSARASSARPDSSLIIRRGARRHMLGGRRFAGRRCGNRSHQVS